MSEGNKSLSNLAEEAQNEPITLKDKIIGAVVALLLIAFCVGTWMNPELVAVDASDFSGRRGRGIARLLSWLWSRPAGTVAGIFGLLVIWGMLTKKVGEMRGDEKRPNVGS